MLQINLIQYVVVVIVGGIVSGTEGYVSQLNSERVSKFWYQKADKNADSRNCPSIHRKLPETYEDGVDHCIRIDGHGSILSKNLSLPPGDISFEFDFKLRGASTTCSDIFTYESIGFISLNLHACVNITDVVDNIGLLSASITEKPGHEAKQYTLKHNLKFATWYHVVIAWKKEESVIQIGVHDLGNYITGVEIPLQSYIDFNSENSTNFIAFGTNLKEVEKERRDSNDMELWIDEFKIWKRALDTEDVKHALHPEVDEDIIHFFHFFEGKGPVTSDSTSEIYLYLIGHRGTTPSWTICPKSTKRADFAVRYEEINETFANEAKSICQDIIYHDGFLSQCSEALPPVAAQYFYIMCLNDCTKSGNAYAAINSLEQYANFCQKSKCSSFWPGYPVCDTLSPSIAPTQCNQNSARPCYAGQLSTAGKCACDRGWFGDACTSICPGGVDHPCGDYGICDQQTGRCLCPMNFDSLNNCTKCNSPYMGKDCNFYLLDLDDKLASVTSSGYGYARYTTFSGLVYDLPLHGEFKFVESENLVVYVRQIPTADNKGNLRFYIDQIWFTTDGIDVTIATPEKKAPPLIKIEGKFVKIEKGKEHGILISDNILLWKISDSLLELETNNTLSSKNNLFCNYVRINLVNNMLSLYVTCIKTERKRIIISNNCTLSNLDVTYKPMNIFKTRKSDFVTKFAKECSTYTDRKSGFVYKKENGYVEPRTLTFGGNALRFFTELQSAEESTEYADFLVRTENVENNLRLYRYEGITYEMYIKRETDGIFLSYFSGSKQGGRFDLAFHKNAIIIRVNGLNWTDTGISLKRKKSEPYWQMLSINCKGSNSIWFYSTTMDEIVHESYMFFGVDCLASSGYITLGGRNEDTDVSNITSSFSGVIDEIKIWDRALNKFETLQNFGIKFDANDIKSEENSREPALLALWTFDEGRGDVVRSLTGGLKIIIKTFTSNSNIPKRHRKVSWVPSDSPVISLCQQFPESNGCSRSTNYPYLVYADDSDEFMMAEETCRKSLEPLYQNKVCKEGLGKNQDVFSKQCIEDVLRENSSAEADVTKRAYASLCRFTLDLEDPCMSNPCQHEGLCITVEGTEYVCECTCGYMGSNCEVEINECENNPCTNGGRCTDEICQFRCDCPQEYVGNICQRKCIEPLGLESRSIPDSDMTASSEYQSGLPWYISYLASRGRLNQRGWGGSWVPQDGDKDPWLQISFPESMRITGIALQGANWNGYNSWVTEFSISTSKDGNEWINYDEKYGGNINSYAPTKIILHHPIEGCYFRIHPNKYHIRPAIRMELYGCSACDCCSEMGMESFYIEDSQITASSIHDLKCDRCASYKATWPRFGRLDGPKNKYADFNIWMAEKNDHEPWIMVDLLAQQYINGIIVQGGNYYRYPIYTKSFKIKYSLDNVTWSKIDEIIRGNDDSTSHKRIVFENPFKARFVKVVLRDWENHPGIRFELLGCSTDEYF